MHKPFVIMGPTASGKSDLAVAIARKTAGQIISADSRQIYKYLTVGTAKPPKDALSPNPALYYSGGVIHHLVDFLEPADTYSLARFSEDAAHAQSLIESQNQTPVFCGGTGLYIQSYFCGVDNLPQANPSIREKLETQIKELGNKFLHGKLIAADPSAAAAIPPQNTQRLIRALEVYEITGKPISSFWTKQNPSLPINKANFIYLKWPAQVLRRRIEERTKQIFNGMAQETQNLLIAGMPQSAPAFNSLGYREAIQFIKGEITRAQAVDKIIALTAQYAKRQRTWFNRYEGVKIIDFKDIDSFDVSKLSDYILNND